MRAGNRTSWRPRDVIERAQARKTEAHRERLTTCRAAEIVVGDVERAEHYTTRESSRNQGADSSLAERVLRLRFRCVIRIAQPGWSVLVNTCS